MSTGVSLLDFKLGVRMMARYPGLTLVGVLALTVAIGLSTAWFEFTRGMFSPTLPLENGERIVAIRNWDVEKAAPEPRSLHDFVTWREELQSIHELGAASLLEHTLSTEDGRSASVQGAQITASGFRLARVSPLLGRPLLEQDERVNAPGAVVIGYDLWQRLFDGDRGVVGRTVRLGNATSTVVGVMPEGFGFPKNQEIWVPFRANPLDFERREGPAIVVFGRLAPGFTLEEARAELTSLGQRTAAALPETHAQLRPRVDGYVDAFIGGGALALSAFNLPFLLLLLVICANVATLVFARTVTRETELVTRSALGASRKRLVLQLFFEALVLTSLSAVIGLAAAAWATEWGMNLFWEIQESRPPFWLDNRLSLSTVLYTMALAVLSAAVVGAVPALKATGRNLRRGLTGNSRLRFGAISTGVIVVQVALCVVFLPIAVARTQDALGGRIESIGFPARDYLAGRLTRQLEAPLGALPEASRSELIGRSAELQEEVRRRVASVPGVSAVAFTDRIPGMNHPYEWLQIGHGPVAPDSATRTAARALSVDPGFFEMMDARILSGRGFQPSDLESAVGVAIVDEAFVRENLGGRNAVGQRLRYPGRSGEEAERWYEIVGVVQDLAMNAYGPGGYQDLVQMGPAGYVGVYHPLRPGEPSSVQMFLRTDAPNASVLVPEVVAAVTSLDPTLGVDDLKPLDEVWEPSHRGERLLTGIFAAVAAIVVGLSAAGIYALTSFTVSQRTREIGIRVALGADPRRIIRTIFFRALMQIGLGVLAGGMLFGLVGGVETAKGVWLLAAMAGLMLGVGLLACVQPAARALRIQPTEALRADG